MKNILKYTISFFIIVNIVSCAASKYNKNYSEETIRQFEKMAIIEPFVEIYELGTDERMLLEDVSNYAKSEFKSYLNPFITDTKSKYYNHAIWQKAQIDTLESLIDTAYVKDDVSEVTVPLNLFDGVKEDKIIVSYIKGFIKSDSRRRSERWKTIGIGIITVGMFIPVYYSSNITLYSVMIDRSSNQVVYKERINLLGADPRKSEKIHDIVNKGVTSHFALAKKENPSTKNN